MLTIADLTDAYFRSVFCQLFARGKGAKENRTPKDRNPIYALLLAFLLIKPEQQQ